MGFQVPVAFTLVNSQIALDNDFLGRLDEENLDSANHKISSFVKLPVAHPVQSGIDINGWQIRVIKGPITSQKEYKIVEHVSGIANLPEMLFGRNSVTLSHKDGFQISLNAIDALKTVAKSVDNDSFKVKMAHAWSSSMSAENEKIASPVNDCDWTFSPNYSGKVPGDRESCLSDDIYIVKANLQKPERILFSDKITLYEDELADNGIATLNVQIRVMPSSFFILLRFFLRIDDVALRIRDTRIYHSFGSSHVQREIVCRDMPVAALGTEAASNTSNLLNDRWVSDHMVPSDPFFHSASTPPYIDSNGDFKWNCVGRPYNDREQLLEQALLWKSQNLFFSMKRELFDL